MHKPQIVKINKNYRVYQQGHIETTTIGLQTVGEIYYDEWTQQYVFRQRLFSKPLRLSTIQAIYNKLVQLEGGKI